MQNFQKYLLESNKSALLGEATHFYFPTHQYLKVPPSEKFEFWSAYCERVSEGSPCFLGEVSKSKEYLPFALDIQLIYDIQSVPQRFEEVRRISKEIDDYVSFLIMCIQEMFVYYFEARMDKLEYVAVYLRNDENMLIWRDNRVYFNGKIIFPSARIIKTFIPKFFDYVLHHIRTKNGSPSDTMILTTKPFTGLDTVMKPITGEIIEMYGYGLSGSGNLKESTDSSEFMKIIKIYHETGRVIQLAEAFSPYAHNDVISQLIPQGAIHSRPLEFWSPLFLSLDYFPQTLSLKSDQKQLELAPNPKMSDIMKSGESFDKLNKLRNLLALVNTDRAEQEWSWTDIGAGIYSVDSGKDGLQIWKWFTAESDMKTDEDCDKKWTEFSVDTGITIATLEYFASKDNFGRYSIWQREEIEKAITTAYTEQTHVAIAKAFIACFPHELVCTDFSNSIWYYYKGHSWIRSNGNHIILFYLNEKFTPILYEIRSNLTAKANHVKGAEKGSNELYITMIQQLITQLGKSGFKKNIAEELKIYYYNANFVKFRDLNEFFTGCPNGVIDVRGHKAIFRHGKPEDFITKSACYYPEHYNMETLIVKEVLHYFHQVYRNKNVRGFVWRFFSSCLRGRNVNKIFAIFVGEGNNSKSMIFALLQLVLGSYVAHLPTSLITGKESGANNATPALVYALGAKLLIMEEPNPNEVAQSGTIKKLTGNVDKQFLRDCFQKGADIVDQPVTGKVVVVANEPLKIDDCQRAIWQRTVLVDHPSRWVHPSEAPLTEEEQFITGLFPDDPNFSMKLPTYAPACLWLLVYFYEDYVKEGMNQPKEVVESTDLFRIASNYYMAFIKDRVRQEMTAEGVPNTGMFIQLNETYNAFKTWWKAEQITQKPPDKTTFKKNMQIVLKANLDINDKWYGLRLEVPQPTAGTLGGLFAF